MLTGQQVQRLNSHIASISPHFHPVLAGVAGKIAAAFPAARAGLDVRSATQRYHAAEGIAAVLKHLADLDELRPSLVRSGAALASQGVDMAAAAPVAVRAVLDGVRAASGEAWTSELERDWRDLLGTVSAALADGAARQLARTRGVGPARLAA